MAKNMLMNMHDRNTFAAYVKQRVKNLKELPPLPEIARQLLYLRNTGGDVQQLVNILSKDPSLSAQVIRIARSPFYGYGDRIKTVDQAVLLVLGYDKTLHISLGLAAGKALRMSNSGPLGRSKFWKKALVAATVAQKLAAAMPAKSRPEVGVCYLSGLLHNFGLMLFAQLYPKEFDQLNTLFEQTPGTDLRELELRCFGVSHDFIGMWLMKAWDMPEEVIVAVSEHHFPDYDGNHAIYAKLTALASCYTDRSEDDHPELLSKIAADIGLDPDKICQILNEVSEADEDINSMVDLLAA